jgi:dipeptidyl aminopeptidase/acylaminoacyl peptidase
MRTITAEDLLRFRFVSDPVLSRDGARWACAVRSIEGEHYRQHLWVDGRAFTTGAVLDALPRFSPDGRSIAFLRKIDDDNQIWILPAAGGEGRRLTSFPPGKFKALEWSPDASKLVFVWRRTPDKKPLARHITRLRYKEDGVGFLDGEYDHVWTVDVASGALRQLTWGDFDHHTPAWSPDGAWIAYTANRHPEADYHPMLYDLYVVPSEGGDARKLAKPAGPAFAPSWSPDGTRIAYLGHDDPESGWGVRNIHVWLVPVDGREPARDITAGLDRPCENVTVTDTKSSHGAAVPPRWSEDGRELYFLVSDRGNCHLYRWNGTIEPRIAGDREITGFAHARGRFALTISDPTSVGDLYTWNGELRRETNLNPLDDIRVSVPERFGERGWLLKPPGFDASRKYPLILQIHGGPRAQYGNAFFHEFQLLAAEGYLVLYTNPPGSQGYGEAFAGSIREDWGNRDYADLMKSVDEACRLPFVDATRLGVCGGSYGGYMTNWIVGHTDRFKAAITMRSVTNLLSFGGTSDIGQEDAREFGAHAFDDPERLARLSPITYVKNIRTPLLILHSENDLRCPMEQAEQLYLFLKMLRRDVELVRFPEESHDLSRTGRPDRRLERLRHILRWWRSRL